ncbi:MAG TPA: DUF2334 domain-containing protein [Fibrobacteria bacterium]|nr:DUF2334 domain-containing protein [Fibrobacteria bacterium]
MRAFAAPALAAAAILASASPAPCGPRPGATVTVGLRYDDCAATSPGDLETRILAACARNRIPITFGVVPAIGTGDNHDPAPAGNLPLPQSRKDMLAAARERGGLEIALHGYAHRAARSGVRSEFSGVPAERQREILARGKAELEAFAGPVRTFIPPWNSYDAGTLAALSATGFTVLSADAGRIADPALALRYVPATCLIPELRRAVAAARAAGGGIVIPYFHPYEIKGADSPRALFSMDEFEAALEWLAAQPDVQTLTLGEIGASPAADAQTYARYARWARLEPPFLEKTFRPAFRAYPRPAFPIPGGAVWLRLAVASGYLVAAAAGLGAARFAGRLLFRKGTSAAWAGSGAVMAVSGLVLGTAGVIGAAFPEAVSGASLFGLGLGTWRSGRAVKHRV